jgi:hypothetical protein
MIDVMRELNLPEPHKPLSEWSDAECRSMADLLALIGKYLDLDLTTMPLNEVMETARRALKQGELPDAFYDELLTVADRGRLQ